MMTDADSVEIVALGDFDPVEKRRDFDAVSYRRYYWRGRLDFVLWGQPVEGRIYVFSDRSDVLGDDYGMRLLINTKGHIDSFAGIYLYFDHVAKSGS